MDLGLAGRCYVVSGGTRGLGFATAETLVGEGASVVVSSRDAGHVRTAVTELGGDERARGVVADVSGPEAAGRLVAAARESFGRLDGALISVGGPPGGSTLDADESQWRAAFETVLLGAVRLARAVVANLGDGGSIAFVLSTSVRTPIPGLGISNALRPGLAMVAKEMATELGPRGIRVNGLMPGRIDTDRMKRLLGQDASARQASEGEIPLRRLGTPTEFGRAAAFLLSPAASYLTGVMLPVDGGLLRSL
jgi:3-oxoacyl-[acyl-carrier protein] reductase